MKLKVLVLGLIIIGTAFAPIITESDTPVLNKLPMYSQGNYNLTWTWVGESYMRDDFTNGSCDLWPCFYWYEIRENISYDGYIHTFMTHYVSPQSNKTLEIKGRSEAVFYYEVRAVFNESYNRQIKTYWSEATNTTVDISPPNVSVASNQSQYNEGDLVYISANASDSRSGVANLSLYINGILKMSSTGNITYLEALSAGYYTYFANVTDRVGLVSRDPPGDGSKSFWVVGVIATSQDTIPPNVSITASKRNYSNNETVYLHVVANDSGSGLKGTDVFVNNELKCTNSSTNFTCAVGPYVVVSNGTSVVYNYNATAEDNAGNKNTTASKNFTVVGNSSCNDFGYAVSNGQCASNGTQSFICRCYLTGCAFLKKCADTCFCPSGFLCNFSTQACFLLSGTQTCLDGTPYGYCSATKPMYCSDGILINKCSECGCPTSQACNTTNQSCYVPKTLSCSDGTVYGQCSIVRPKYCNNGVLIDYCSLCGCLSGTQCSLVNNSCFIPSNPEKYIKLEPISPNATSMVLSPGQTALFNVRIKDERGRLVSNATVMLNPKTMNYTSTNLGNGLYEVSYKVSLNATGSFLISIMATRGENETDTLTFQVEISRILDIEFLNPKQNADVMDSRQVEAKIKYPNGDPVLFGDFEMGLGNKTFVLGRVEDKYRGFLNLSGESYGAKNISFSGRDLNGNALDGLLVINYVEKKDYTVFFVAFLVMAGAFGASYFVYKWGKDLSKDYKTLKKEKIYLETMDKRTHLEFFKRHIDENTFKKLVLEYQQKTTDVDRIIAEMEKRHRWLRWI